MSRRRSPAALLALAVRHRQWQVEARLPGLAAGADAERMAQAARVEAEAALDRAQVVCRQRVSGAPFDAGVLMRHAAFGLRVRTALAEADARARQARLEADELRAQARELVAERDAFQQRLDRLDESARTFAARRAACRLDELWLVREASARAPDARAGGGRDEG